MKHFCFYVLVGLLTLSCQKNYNKNIEPHLLIPETSDLILKVNALNDFNISLETNPILSTLYKNDLKGVASILDKINVVTPIYIVFEKNSNNSTDFLILSETELQFFAADSLSVNKDEQLIETGITNTIIESTEIYSKTISGIFTATNNIDFFESINNRDKSTDLFDLINTTDNSALASVIFKSNDPKYANLLFSKFNNEDYVVIDINQNSGHLAFNGVISSKDTITNILGSFKSTLPQKINSPKISPSNTSILKSLSFDDYSKFGKNIKDSISLAKDSARPFLTYCNEIALIDNALILHSLDTNLLTEAMGNKSYEESFREVDIYSFSKPNYFKNHFNHLIDFKDASFLFVKDDFVVFSNSIENLKQIISAYLSNNTLANSEAFQNIQDNLSDESSLFIYKNAEALSNAYNKDLSDYSANVVQYIYEEDYALVNGIMQKFEKRRAKNSIKEFFSTSLEADILVGPQALKNHITKTKDVVVQDINNTLYLISNSGNVLWKKKIKGEILGKIEQIDIYKNGRLQMVFATPSRVYVIDRNGKDVGPFPLKFNDPITQPLSLFDYDNRKEYRLLVTQSKNLLMYNTKAKLVKGFSYNNNNKHIITQPKHFKIGSKDYIVFGAGDILKILNRRGKVRIAVKDPILFSDNSIYLHQNQFTTTNSLGQLVQVNTKGKISRKQLNLSGDHAIDATNKTLVSLQENKLKIRSKVVDLDFGEYTLPIIFYLNDKIYVSTTDLQSKKVYLFDSQAKSIPNFPVFGTSSAELQELDKDKGLELITQSDSKTILTYKLY